MCEDECDINEELRTEDGDELWCYCKKCDIETFHLIPQ